MEPRARGRLGSDHRLRHHADPGGSGRRRAAALCVGARRRRGGRVFEPAPRSATNPLADRFLRCSLSSREVAHMAPNLRLGIRLAVFGFTFILPATVGAQTPVYLTQWGSFGSGNGQFMYPTGVATD